MSEHTYYKLSAYSRPNKSSESRDDDIVTILHYDATADRRVVNGVFVEEANTIPSLTFDIYNDNPGYEMLAEFDTRISLEEMYDAVASDYVGDPIVELELIEGTEDEYRLVFLDNSEVDIELVDASDDAYSVLIPRYVSVVNALNNAGIIIEDDFVLSIGFISTDVTIPTVKFLFEGRVIKNSIYLESDGLLYREITCEGLMGYLNDSIQPYVEERLWEDDETSSGLYKYMEHLLEVHNAQVEPYKRIYIGVCDTTTNLTNDQVVKGTNWQTTWEVIEEKLLDVYGGEIKVEHGTDGLLYLYYTDKMSELNVVTQAVQPIRLGVNIIKGSYEPQVDQVITRLYPLGAKLEDENGDTTDERLTIAGASKSGGLTYIEDAAMKSIYGVVPATKTWDDVTVADNLYSKAIDWLAENNNYPVSLTLSAYDLSLLGYDYEHLELYRDVIVDAEPLETESLTDGGKLEIVRRSLSLDNPWQTTLTFGDTTRTASKRYADIK